MNRHFTLTFYPRNAQFILFDVNALPDSTEDTLWERDDEEGPLSVRTTKLAVGLFDHYRVEVETTIYDQLPAKLDGLWEVETQASLLIESGELGIGDVTGDIPELILNVSKGWTNVRVFGNWLGIETGSQVAQSFHLQIWPKTGIHDPTISPT